MKALLSILGRICLSAIFLLAGVQKILDFNKYVNLMEGAKYEMPYPEVQLVGAIIFLLVGSVLLILGYWARLGAAMLAVFLIMTMIFFHAFWIDPGEQIAFMKNLGMLGGMLFIIGNGAGAGSLDARNAATQPG